MLSLTTIITKIAIDWVTYKQQKISPHISEASEFNIKVLADSVLGNDDLLLIHR